MIRRPRFAGTVIAAALMGLSACALLPTRNPWPRVNAPTATAPEAIGSYSAGCVRGALPLPLSGPGYAVMRPGRRRYFGHPRLISYLENLAVQVSSATGTTLLFGDLGMPRGGPTLSAHASHQTGLDADVWYARLSSGTAITSDQRESLQSKSVVDGEFGVVNGRWEGAEAQVLRLAASSPEVDRIFVNPSIKKMLCANNRGAEWLSRLRPWWQHDDHFHVRLKCGSTDPLCVNRADPIPPGDGCDATLDSWFDPQMRAKERRMREYPSPSSMPTLPPQCADVLREPAPPAR